MIRVTPYKLSSSKAPVFAGQQEKKRTNPSFAEASVAQVWAQSYPVAFPLLNLNSLSWVKNKNLLDATNKLSQIKFDKDDVKHVQSMGVVLPFQSGLDAVNYIKERHIGIRFETLSSPNIHAQYDYDSNSILINDLYKNANNPAMIFAIAESILHEAGHAKDQDGISTVQEEIDCLAMNALAHRFLCKNNPSVFERENSLIVKDGVRVYADLFFDNNLSKIALINRVSQKYGHLQVGDFKHSPTELAFSVKNTQCL